MNTEHYLVLSADADDVPGTLSAHGWFGDYESATAYADCNGGVAISCGREYRWIEVARHEVYGLIVVTADDYKNNLNVMIKHRVKRQGGKSGTVVQVQPWFARAPEMELKQGFIDAMDFLTEHADPQALAWLDRIEVERNTHGQARLIPVWVA